MKNASSGSVLLVGLAATVIFGLGLATFVTQNVVAETQEEDDDRNGGFDLKDWCAVAVAGDVLTIKAEGITLSVDVGGARGNRPRPTTTGTPAGTPGTGGLVGHLVRVRGAVNEGVWDANVLNVKQARCDTVTGEPIDHTISGTPGTPQATRTPRPTRTPRAETTRTPGPPDENPGLGRGPVGNPGQGHGSE